MELKEFLDMGITPDDLICVVLNKPILYHPITRVPTKYQKVTCVGNLFNFDKAIKLEFGEKYDDTLPYPVMGMRSVYNHDEQGMRSPVMHFGLPNIIEVRVLEKDFWKNVRGDYVG